MIIYKLTVFVLLLFNLQNTKYNQFVCPRFGKIQMNQPADRMECLLKRTVCVSGGPVPRARATEHTETGLEGP